MKPKYWWIKERHNPQIGIYYTGLGNLPIHEAKKHEKSLYGDNYLLRYSSENEYTTALIELTKALTSEY